MKTNILLLLLAISFASVNPANAQITGKWYGKLIINEKASLTIAFEIKGNPNSGYNAVMHSVDQKAYNIEVDSVFTNESELFLSVKMLGLVYKGKKTSDTEIIGHIIDPGGQKNELNMVTSPEFPFTIAARPQEPSKPYPYISEDIQFINPEAGIKLKGTITTPSKKGKYPAIVLISGSGASDRNQTIFGHKTFLVISDFLTKAGYVVLRYDDRGAGESEGSFINATIIDHARDASFGAEYLKTLEFVDTCAVGILGHSLGADIAPVAASLNQSISFVILMAGAAQHLSDVIIEQCKAIYTSNGTSQEGITLNETILNNIYSIIEEESDLKIAREKAATMLKSYNSQSEALSEEDRDKLGFTTPLTINAWASLFTPYMKYDLFHDNSDYLARLKCPVLVLGGDKDLQVLPHHVDLIKEQLEKSGNNNVQAKLYPGKNHLMQDAVTGSPSEYGDIENTIAPDVIADIITWLNSL